MLTLLRERPRFRLLFLADALSMIGDWLTYVAVGLLALGGLGIGATWVGATVWLQKIVPDPILGRYAALDVSATSAADAARGIVAALLSLHFGPLVTLGSVAAIGLAWLAAIRPRCVAAAAIVLALAAPVRAQGEPSVSEPSVSAPAALAELAPARGSDGTPPRHRTTEMSPSRWGSFAAS